MTQAEVPGVRYDPDDRVKVSPESITSLLSIPFSKHADEVRRYTASSFLVLCDHPSVDSAALKVVMLRIFVRVASLPESGCLPVPP